MKLTFAILASIISFSTLAHADVLTNARLSQLEKVVQGQQRQISRLENKVRQMQMSDLAVTPTPIRQVDPSEVCRLSADILGNMAIEKKGQQLGSSTNSFAQVVASFTSMTEAGLCTLGGAEKCDMTTDILGNSYLTQNQKQITSGSSTANTLARLKELRKVGACQ